MTRKNKPGESQPQQLQSYQVESSEITFNLQL